MSFEKLRTYRARNRWLEGLLFQNPVFVRGLALPFAIVVTGTLKDGVLVSFLMACSLIPSVLTASLVGRRLPKWATLMLCALLSIIIIVAMLPLLAPMALGNLDSLGIYVPILSLNSMMGFLCLRHRGENRRIMALVDSLTYSVGFAFALCLIAALRELWGANTIWGIPVTLPLRMTGLQFAFAGFIVTAFLCAFFQAAGRCIRGRIYRRENPPAGKEAPNV